MCVYFIHNEEDKMSFDSESLRFSVSSKFGGERVGSRTRGK